MADQLVSRRILDIVRERMDHTAVVALQGARAVGKSTVLASIAADRQARVVDLDDPALVDLVAASPPDYVQGGAPVCIDEYQRVPELLQAIKAELNRDNAPGRFVLTGSTRFDRLPRASQALTGRIQFLDILPFSQGEIDGVREDFVDVAIREPERLARLQPSSTTRAGYAARVCRGGLPAVVRLTERQRRNWFEAYLTQTLSSDVPELAGTRRLGALSQLFERLAAQTGQLLNVAAAARCQRPSVFPRGWSWVFPAYGRENSRRSAF